MASESRHDQSDTPDPATGTTSNRYILLAVIAVAVVAAVYLLKSNMEPPQSGSTEQSGEVGMTDPDGILMDTTMMQELSHQIEHIRSVLARDSSNFDAWVALGNLYFDSRMAEEAIIHYERALQLRPGDVNVMTDLATMQREAGRPSEAVATLARVVAIDSVHPQSWFNMGVIYAFDLKQPEEAIAAWRKFLALSDSSEHTEAVRREIESLEKNSGK
ncbi:MAG: tetratricopeptide repeat protein [Candidatus Zixiibacteriota bacterium]